MSSSRPLYTLTTVCLIIVAIASIVVASHADVTFTDIDAGLVEEGGGSVVWGDYDNDGDLDILQAGEIGSRVYRNDGGDTFTDISAGLEAVHLGSAAWGDYDNDEDLDILLAGELSPMGRTSRVYRNDGGGTFTDIGAGLEGINEGCTAWGDYDNDGDLDILLIGLGDSQPLLLVYRNDGGDTFTDSGAGLEVVNGGSAAWGDYDNDGDLDILLTGYRTQTVSHVYRNDGGGVFTDIDVGLEGIDDGCVAWGDYDNDGDLDIVLAGRSSGTQTVSHVYRNDPGDTFTDIGAGLEGVRAGAVAWGDYDNDGDLDILLTGYTGAQKVSHVYRNDGGDSFTDMAPGLPGTYYSSVAWGDYDGDGDLDILLAGYLDTGSVTRVYKSNGAPANIPPAAPVGLETDIGLSVVTLGWNASADGQTPSAGLSYNLRVGTTPGGSEIMAAMSDGATGYRRVAQLGNAQVRTSWTLTLPGGSGTLYWSVQAVDGAFAGSAFATEEGSPFSDTQPWIETIVDIPDDQGHQVRVTWWRSGLDAPGSSTPIEEYTIFRRIDESPRSPSASPTGINETQGASEGLREMLSYPPGEWDFITTVPAYGEDSYNAVCETLCDSTNAGGMCWSVFFVRAGTADPTIYFDALPDSGYSIDNLAPTAPTNLRWEGPDLLAWDESEAEDLDYFTVYGSEVDSLDETAMLIDYTIDTSMDVSESLHLHYLVTATDFHGNEGEDSGISSPTAVSDEPLPRVYAFRLCSPNPFRTAAKMSFDLPEAGNAKLEVFDVMGRSLRALIDKVHAPGRYVVEWNGNDGQGRPATPGVYFIRFDSGEFSAVRKVVIAH
ncbi:FG-GAP-like repeat-containing protein [Candidatus Eisenbacteria bacterium]|uniref:FG-GAP-like repeat-containing protein n=1 Tax=Eiseniibacteriota bacterium TaxID=2212470 RepID=A0ABV6YLV7_UNCEI